MEDTEMARRKDLGLSLERIKKNRALNRNVDMAGLSAYFKVFHHLPKLSSTEVQSDKVRMLRLSSYSN